MQKPQKEGLINEVRCLLEQSSIVLVIKHNALTVSESCNIRSEVRKLNSSYKIVKNTLMNIALTATQFESLNESLTGQTAVVFSNSPAEIAKLMYDFANKYKEKLEVISGCYNGKLMTAAEVEILSKLPSLDVLRSQIIAIIKTPSQNVYSCIKAPAEQIVRVLRAYAEK